ncbi:MAG: Asp23/Gls24 family envelope stress response protein, partial [Pyramidobacter sp.]
PEGVRVSLEEGTQSQISVDAYVLVRYGLRIPDVAWDLQEFLKKELESSTGYEVKAVNIFVQGVYFGEQAPKEEQGTGETGAKAAATTAGE